jgi:Ser-tRNA(Ala) deacylase AlaX
MSILRKILKIMESAAEEKKSCLTCGKEIQGRSDKKFCDDYCRNSYNNYTKGSINNLVRNINNILKKNRNILESLIPSSEEVSKANREKLNQLGFQFKYMTHTYTNKKGNIYFYCYDYGYLPLEKDWFLIVRGREE